MKVLKHYAELALLYGFPDFIRGDLPRGRFKNLCSRLQKECGQDLCRLIISETDKNKALALLRTFMKQAGWYKKSRHVTTYLSFCLSMIENSQFHYKLKITETLNALIDHLEHGGFLHDPYCWAGDLAARKWRALFEPENLREIYDV